jgi:hypothetical protein
MVRADDTPATHRERAAALYDDAVRAFDRSDFAAAANDFLAADQIVPSRDALDNALTAAERAQKPLLVIAVAERMLGRSDLSPSLLARARRAFENAKKEVGWLVLACNAPCELRIDGTPAPPGRVAVTAGVHVVSGAAANGASSERRIDVGAGSEEELTLDVRSHFANLRGSTPIVSAPLSAVSARHDSAPTRRPATEDEPARPLPRAAFFAGGAVSVVLAGVTTWSGVDALRARNRLPGTRAQTEDVRDRMHRTDALLVGTLVASALTTYAGLVWVDWTGTP